MTAQRFRPFAPVSARYGAPMGRRSHPGTPSTWNAATKLCAQHQGGSGDYDRGGAYWGSPCNVWAVWEWGKSDNGVVYVRAGSADQAKQLAREF